MFYCSHFSWHLAFAILIGFAVVFFVLLVITVRMDFVFVTRIIIIIIIVGVVTRGLVDGFIVLLFWGFLTIHLLIVFRFSLLSQPEQRFDHGSVERWPHGGTDH